MDVRGERECRECGAQWSYYETGSIRCPTCDSVRSRGVGERALHTDAGVELDLSEVRERAADEDYREAARLARDTTRTFLAGRGFISGGELRPLGETYRRAAELRYVADGIERRLQLDDDVVERFLALLREEETGGPPAALRGAYGLAAADAADAYASEIRTWLEANQPDTDPTGALERLREHVSRAEALDGEIAPETAEKLVAAARDIGRACREDDPTALAAAEETLTALEKGE